MGEGDEFGGEGQRDGEERAGAAPAHIKGGRNRTVQLARKGRRRFFRGAARREFLEWFAATANVVWSARRTGFCHQTIWKHRMNDPAFAADFDRALDQATVRVTAKLVESKAEGEPTQINGDYEAPELGDIDPQVALNLLREHERCRGGPPAGFGRKQGRRPRIATNAEVRAALVKGLAAFGVRVSEGQAGGKPLPLEGGGRVEVDYSPAAEPAPTPPSQPSPIQGEG